MARLGDVCEILNGYAFKSANYTDKGVRIIRISNVQKGFIEDNTPAFYPFDDINVAKYELFEGDLLLSLTGNVGRVGRLDKKFLPAALNQRVACIRIKDNIALDKSFLFDFLNSDSFEQKCILSSKGVAQKNLSTEWLKDYKIPLLPLEEQRKIAAILDKVSDLIAKRRQQLDKLDELVKARFVEMFGDFKYNTMGWPTATFKEIATIDSTMTTDFEKYANYPHIGIDSIEKGTGKLTGYRTVAEDGVISGKYAFTPNHIIYSKIRPNLNKVALPDFEGLCSADAYPILPMPDKCNRVFLAYDMRSQFFLDYILQFCNRTNLPKVNRKEVEGFVTPIPSIELQNQFATFVEQTEKTKTTISCSLEKLEILKKALMQKYFG